MSRPSERAVRPGRLREEARVGVLGAIKGVIDDDPEIFMLSMPLIDYAAAQISLVSMTIVSDILRERSARSMEKASDVVDELARAIGDFATIVSLEEMRRVTRIVAGEEPPSRSGSGPLRSSIVATVTAAGLLKLEHPNTWRGQVEERFDELDQWIRRVSISDSER